MTARLALAGQQTQLAEEQLTALREQLRTVTAQLAESQAERQNSDQKAQALNASLHRQNGVSISPNNSFLQTLPVIRSPASMFVATAT